MEFTFILNEQEAQIVLDALVKEPYGLVVNVVGKIQKQAIEQRQKAEYKNQGFGVNIPDSDKAV